MLSKLNRIIFKMADINEILFHSDSDFRSWIYIYIKGDNGGRSSGPSQVLPGLCNRQIMTMMGNWPIRFT